MLSQTVPTGFSGLPPPGPASPVTASAKAAQVLGRAAGNPSDAMADQTAGAGLREREGLFFGQQQPADDLLHREVAFGVDMRAQDPADLAAKLDELRFLGPTAADDQLEGQIGK